jgi:hypothetical protein
VGRQGVRETGEDVVRQPPGLVNVIETKEYALDRPLCRPVADVRSNGPGELAEDLLTALKATRTERRALDERHLTN